MKLFKYIRALYLDRKGMKHLQKNQYKEAVSIFMHAGKLFKEIKDRAGMGKQAGNLAMAYRVLAATKNDSRYINKGIEYGEQALKISREVKDKVMEAHALNDLGNLYSTRSDQSKPASIVGTKDNPMLHLSAEGIQNFVGDNTRAIEYLEKAVEAFREIGDLEMVGSSSFMLAITLAKAGFSDRALTVAKIAAKVLTKTNSLLLKDVNQFLMMVER